MAKTVSVKLPRSRRPCFPKECVVCGREDPPSQVRIYTSVVGWWTAAFLWMVHSPFVVKAPACRGCGWRLQAVRFANLLVIAGAVILVYVWIWPHFKAAVPQGLHLWARIGIATLVLLPYMLFQILFPEPFDVIASSKSVDYEFASFEYALSFAVFNLDAEWVKIDGVDVNELLRASGSDADLQLSSESSSTD